MKKFQPRLTDLKQVFGVDTLEKLDLEAQFTHEAIDWGVDRVVSLAQNDTSIKTQWNGTCTSFATIAALENKLGGSIELSERSLWDAYGVYSTREAIDAAGVFFILEEQFWPQHQSWFDTRYKGKGRFKLINVSYLKSDYSKVINAINNGNPCVVALQTPSDLFSGKPQVEADSGLKKGGHAICVSGYKVENGKGYFLVKNSWGVDNGENGYQYIAFELYNNKGYVLFWEIKEVFDRGQQSFVGMEADTEVNLDDDDTIN